VSLAVADVRGRPRRRRRAPRGDARWRSADFPLVSFRRVVATFSQFVNLRERVGPFESGRLLISTSSLRPPSLREPPLKQPARRPPVRLRRLRHNADQLDLQHRIRLLRIKARGVAREHVRHEVREAICTSAAATSCRAASGAAVALIAASAVETRPTNVAFGRSRHPSDRSRYTFNCARVFFAAN
jgi:hypothetical protein